jgi:hypothetical protein
LLVRTREANFAKRRPVGSQLVGNDNRRNETLVTKEFAGQPQCRDLVALGLNENFENLAFAVNGTHMYFGVRRSRPPFRRDANECKVWARLRWMQPAVRLPRQTPMIGVSPFLRDTLEPALRACQTRLDAEGRYLPDHETLDPAAPIPAAASADPQQQQPQPLAA